MRILVFFDLPVKLKKDRKEYQRFRKLLINNGYDMLQFSVYSRICNGKDSVNRHMNFLKKYTPHKGSIRVLTVTEKQFSTMEILAGEKSMQENIVNDQLSLFF